MDSEIDMNDDVGNDLETESTSDLGEDLNADVDNSIDVRLSRDDAASESLSIPNQHALLNMHIDGLEISNARVLEFVDNGYTGTNYERPAVQEMLELVRSGKVHCIVCKDFSRFGRNILETGYFIEQVFPLYGIRFIAVTDRYDSVAYKGNTGGIDVAFKFLIHEHYSKDLSKKVKTAKRIRMINGESITANAIYGYYKSDKGKWEIDEGAAAVIKLIFNLALDVNKTSKIRDMLCADKIPVPADYKAMKNGRDIIPGFMWSNAMILNILYNEQYIGTYIAGKHERKMIGSSFQSSVDESEWIKIPNNHPAIIDKDIFERVQQKYTKRKHIKDRQKRDYLLQGRIICGCCKRSIHYGASKNPAYYCNHTLADKNAECHKMRLSVRDIDETVMCIIKKQAAVVLNSADISELRNLSAGEQHIAECKDQILQYLGHHQNIYERFVKKEIDRDTYQSLKNEYAQEIERLNNRLALLKKAENQKADNKKTAAYAKEVLSESASSKEVVETLIEKIYVFPDNRIEIQWKFTNFAENV